MSDHVVFFSYNGADRRDVERIAVLLDDRSDMHVWLDRWRLIPGERWVPNLERAIGEASACAVFIGKDDQGPWQRPEVEAALDRQAHDPEFRVIPVLLPGTPDRPEISAFLKNFTWVDFRKGLDDDNALYLLECGVTGKPPGRGRPASDRPVDGPTGAATPRPRADPRDVIWPASAIPADSRFYIARRFDTEVLDGLRPQKAMVSIIGPRQTGRPRS